jgi:hypothetical protein
MQFREVANVLSRIEEVNPKRLEILAILNEFIDEKYKKGETKDLKNFLRLTLSKFETHYTALDSNFR